AVIAETVIAATVNVMSRAEQGVQGRVVKGGAKVAVRAADASGHSRSTATCSEQLAPSTRMS
nr:hypothetical protein [Tanacetum cinerariifolium]